MSSDNAIVVRNLSKTYELGLTGRTESLPAILRRRLRHPLRGSGETRETFVALDDISFGVAPSEVVGVIGRNGAGKSTLLKILSRITTPSAGYAEIRGTVGSLLEAGTGFHPELTAIGNGYLNGTILGMTKRAIDRRLEEIVEFAEVDKFLNTPVKRYSSGMRVRLAFAVAAHLDAEILIVDEVLSVGDLGFQAKCREKMRSIAQEQGRTVLYVSHNLVSVEHLCRRSMLLVGGRLVLDAPTHETIAAYTNMFPHVQRDGETGVFDLESAERERTSETIFTRLVLRPGDGTPSETVRMKESLQLQISVKGLSELSGASVAVAVSSVAVPNLFRMTSRMQPLRSSVGREAEEDIILDIPSIPLTPGEYFVDVGIWVGAKLLDHIYHAATFMVVAADALGTGYHFDDRDGALVTPWHWELRPSRPHVIDANHESRAATSVPSGGRISTAPGTTSTRGGR